MEALQEILIFGGEVLLVVLGIAAVAILIAALVARNTHKHELEVDALDKHFRRLGNRVKGFTLGAKERKKS